MKNKVMYITYLAIDDLGLQSWNTTKGQFSQNPPLFQNIVDMQKLIEDKYNLKQALILSWQPIADKEI